MRILKAQDASGWITAIISGRWVQAKVYDEPSHFGVDGGRVSKLAISKEAGRVKGKPFNAQMAYHYDRGLDHDELEPRILRSVLKELEALPVG